MKLGMLSNVSVIDSRVYGNDGRLPGVKLDRQNWLRCFARNSIRVVADIPDGTRAAFGTAVSTLASEAMPGDLVVIQHSGHGTQRPDASGDEVDGQDELLCFYDGTLSDDAVWNLLILFRPGVQVLLITDTCHSGTAYRSVVSERILRRAVREPVAINCELLAIGTSSDEQTSADTPNGGAGSNALIATYAIARDYRDWVALSRDWLEQNRFRQTLGINGINAQSFITQPVFALQVGGEQSPPATQPPAGRHIVGVAIYFSDGSVNITGKVSK